MDKELVSAQPKDNMHREAAKVAEKLLVYRSIRRGDQWKSRFAPEGVIGADVTVIGMFTAVGFGGEGNGRTLTLDRIDFDKIKTDTYEHLGTVKKLSFVVYERVTENGEHVRSRISTADLSAFICVVLGEGAVKIGSLLFDEQETEEPNAPAASEQLPKSLTRAVFGLRTWDELGTYPEDTQQYRPFTEEDVQEALHQRKHRYAETYRLTKLVSLRESHYIDRVEAWGSAVAYMDHMLQVRYQSDPKSNPVRAEVSQYLMEGLRKSKRLAAPNRDGRVVGFFGEGVYAISLYVYLDPKAGFPGPDVEFYTTDREEME